MRYTIFIFLFFTTALKTNAQAFPNLQFEHLTTKDGLSNNNIKCLTQDKNGILWIGTINGLNRYDGYRFKKYYTSESDTNSILQNDIKNIYCDSKNRLWLLHFNGITIFEIKENKFIRLKNLNAPTVFEDHNQNIWIGNQDTTLYKLKNDYAIEKYEIKNTTYNYNNTIIRGYKFIYEDAQHQFWGTSSQRIYKLDNNTKQPLQHFNFTNKTFVDIFSIKQDEADKTTYWINGWGGSGLYKFKSKTDKIVNKYFIDKKIGIVTNYIQNWKFQNNNYGLILEINKGLFIINKEDSSYKCLSGNNNLQSHIAKDHQNLFVDNNNNLWISTDNGIFMCKGNKKEFQNYVVNKFGEDDMTKSSKAAPIYFCETDSTYFISRAFDRIYELDKKFKPKNSFDAINKFIENKTTKWPRFIYPLQNELFISTADGIIVYDIKTKQSDFFIAPDLAKNTSLELRTILPFSQNKIIIKTNTNGFFIFNTLLKKFEKHYPAIKDKNEQPQSVGGFINATNGIIYLNTVLDGLYKFNYTTDKFIKINPTNNNQFPLEKEIISSITEDKLGKIWIATNGIIVYNPTTNLIENKFTEDGKIYGVTKICFDKKDNVWANSPTGIWYLNLAIKKWIQYDKSDGLLGDDFQTLLTSTKDGKILVGINEGLAVANPSDDLSNLFKDYKAKITELTTDKNVFSFAGDTTNLKSISLNAGTHSFTINFLVENYENPTDTKYYYILEPLMKEFKRAENGEINFNGLTHGAYELTVKGGDSKGNIFNEIDKIKISIEPYWYQTNLFKILATLLIGFLIYLFFKRRIAIVRREGALKQKITETEIAALKAQMNPHFIFNCINSIDALIQSNDKYNATNYLNKFAKLIRNVLDSSKENTVAFNKDIETLNLYIELEKLRSENKFTTSINVSEELMSSDYKVPPLIVQPFVENAIQHGLRKRKDNNGTLSINVERVEDKIIYHIEDNGIGRAAAAKLTKSEHSSYGIQISNDRIKMFNEEENASIKIDDLYNGEQAVGTKVTVQLKLK